MALFLIKFLHTVIFFFISACILYVLYSGMVNRVTRWTRLSLAVILGEGIVLIINDWKCPLTKLAESLGAADGSVSDIFLPQWFADHLFDICTPLTAVACSILAGRRVWDWRRREPRV